MFSRFESLKIPLVMEPITGKFLSKVEPEKLFELKVLPEP